MAKRLLPSHPLYKKHKALEDFMLKNNISLIYVGGGMRLVCGETDAQINVRDSDDSTEAQTYPTGFETKLILEDY